MLTCPECAARFGLAAAVADDAARATFERVLGTGPLGPELVAYLALHRPAKRALSWPRAARLLDALHAQVETGTVARGGRVLPAPVETWRAGIAAVLARRDAGALRLPLSGHGYLFAAVAGLADAAEAEVERAREAALRARPRRAPAPAARDDADRPTPEQLRDHLDKFWAAKGRKRPARDDAATEEGDA